MSKFKFFKVVHCPNRSRFLLLCKFCKNKMKSDKKKQGLRMCQEIRKREKINFHEKAKKKSLINACTMEND